MLISDFSLAMVFCFNYCALERPGKVYPSPRKLFLEKGMNLVVTIPSFSLDIGCSLCQDVILIGSIVVMFADRH